MGTNEGVCNKAKRTAVGVSLCTEASHQMTFGAEVPPVECSASSVDDQATTALHLHTIAPFRGAGSASGNDTVLSVLCLCTGNKVKRLPVDAAVRTATAFRDSRAQV